MERPRLRCHCPYVPRSLWLFVVSYAGVPTRGCTECASSKPSLFHWQVLCGSYIRTSARRPSHITLTPPRPPTRRLALRLTLTLTVTLTRACQWLAFWERGEDGPGAASGPVGGETLTFLVARNTKSVSGTAKHVGSQVAKLTRHCRLRRPCEQKAEPPQSLHCCRCRPCWQIATPPHSCAHAHTHAHAYVSTPLSESARFLAVWHLHTLQWLRRLLCSQICEPPQSLQGTASIIASSVQSTA